MDSPKTLIKRAQELNMKSLALTDHNNLCGSYKFQTECRNQGIKPILGVELYYTRDTNILSLDADTRYHLAVEAAKKDGIKISDKLTKTKAKEIIKDYLYDTKQYHIILLAMNQIGWNNLIKLQSEASNKCTFNGRYCCDNAMLEKYNEGIILSTACIGSLPAKLFATKKNKEGYELLSTWKKIFKDRFFLEIQPLISPDQIITNLEYIKWGRENKVKIIATADVHYALKEDYEDHDTLICIGTGKLKNDAERMRYDHDFWIKTKEEMIKSFANQSNTFLIDSNFSNINQLSEEEFYREIQQESSSLFLFNTDEYMKEIHQAINNTAHVESLIDDTIKIGSDIPLMPQTTSLTKGLSIEEDMIYRAYQGLYQYKEFHPEIDLKKYEERLREELDVIVPKGFTNYILAVEELVKWCKDNNIAVGPGRGSAAGSLLLFILGVTKGIDPIKYNLLFSRFLTKDRVENPDIDMDFSWSRRQDVIQHLRDKYGENNVSNIGNISFMGVKNSIKDSGRPLGYGFSVTNSITKRLDAIIDKPGVEFKDFDSLKEEESNKYKEFKKIEEEYPELFRVARKFEGKARGMGTHASGILVSPYSVTDHMPTRFDKNMGSTVALYDGKEVESLNFLKLDILGLKNLDIIMNTINQIDEETITLDYLYNELNIEDPEIYHLISSCKTDGVFQLESDMMKMIIKKIQPENLNDIIAITSLGRPGPLSIHLDENYAKRKNKQEKITTPLPGLDDILYDAYGCNIYQEHCMLIAKRVAGFDDTQSDSLIRKPLGKKIAEKLQMARQLFIWGKINTNPPPNYDDNNKDQVMYDPKAKLGAPILGGVSNGYQEEELIEFWKSLESYSSYLFNKSHASSYSYISIITAWLKAHYPVQFMAALISIQSESEKIEQYVNVAKDMGIKIKVPDINLSKDEFTPIPDKKEILYGLSSIKGIGSKAVIDLMSNAPYTSMEDVMNRLSKKSFNKKIAEALIMGGAFDSMEINRYTSLNLLHKLRKDKNYDIYNEEEYGEEECIAFESEILGSSITYEKWWDKYKVGQKITSIFTLKEVRERTDKKGKLMGFFTLEHNNCEVIALMFSSYYAKNINKLILNKEITFTGKKEANAFIITKVS